MAEAGKQISNYNNLSSINGNTVFIVDHKTGNDTVTYSVKASVVLKLLNEYFTNSTPANSSSTGVKGDIKITDNHLYVCIDSNEWKRIELESF